MHMPVFLSCLVWQARTSMHAIGSEACWCKLVATSLMAGLEGGVPAVEGPGGDATLENLSDPAVEAQLGCDAPLEVLLKLIVKEDLPLKRHQLGHVLGGILKEERSVLSTLRKQNELLIKRTKPPPLRGPLSRWSGYATDDGCATNDGHIVEDDPVPMKSRDEDDLIDATERYRDTVYVRNVWEAHVSRDSWQPPSDIELRSDFSEWSRPQEMLEHFERIEIPEIQSAQLSRREAWRNFLRDTPTLRSGLEHHAKWGPDLEKQVQEILVANELAELWTFYKKHEKLYRQKPKSDFHFNIGH